MCRLVLRWLVVGVLAAVAAGGRAQPRFVHLTVDDGLSQNAVSSLLQDQHGFLWIGTEDGLNRYDGYTFTVFTYDPADSTSISDNRIGALLEGRDGLLWVGTADGLNRFDPATATFRVFHSDPTDATSLAAPRVAALHEDSRGRIWIGHGQRNDTGIGGLSRLDPETGEIERLLGGVGPSINEPTPVWDFAETPDGTLWIATGRGVLRYNAANDTFTPLLHDPDDSNTLAADDVRALHVDGDGLLWIATWGGGLDCLDPANGRIEHHRAGTDGTALASDYVSALGRTYDGMLLIGTSVPGERSATLHQYDYKTFERIAHDPSRPESLGPGRVRAILEDHARVLWIGTAGGGLSKFDQASRPIPHFVPDPGDPQSLVSPVVTAFLDEDKLTMWVGTDQGLERFDRFREEFEHLRHDPNNSNSLTDDHVTALARGADGMLWVGTRAGLNRVDPVSRRVRRYRHDPGDRTSLTSNTVHALQVDSAGTVWVGTDAGLNRLDPRTGEIEAFRHNPADNRSLSDDDVMVLFARPDEPEILWVGTDGGLNRFDTATRQATRYQDDPADPGALSHRHVTALAARPGEPDILWVATLAGGLNRLDVRTGRVQRFTRRTSRLPGNTIYGLVPDDTGALWLATNRGLVCFEPASSEVRVYDVDRGVQSRQFNPGAAYRTPRGELAFGGINGFNVFAPDDFRDSPFAPQVTLTSYRVRNEEASGLPGALPLLRLDGLDLSHNRNDLLFEFVGLHFARPERNQYAVRLDGYDDDWREVGTQRRAAYANLPPGRYVFRVKAANSDGVWSEDEASALNVIIAPPFWATWWFRLIAALTVIGLGVAIYKQRVRAIAARNRELEALVAERTGELHEQKLAAETKSVELAATLAQLQTTQTQLVQSEKLASLGRLTAGVAHEIKNPLNFVNNFAQLSEELTEELRTELAAVADRPVAEVLDELKPIIDDLALNAEKIAEHGKRADTIVRSMLLHARGSDGDREPVDVRVLLNETLDLAVHGAATGGDGVPVQIETDYDPAVDHLPIIRQAIGRVVLNLLDNAIYAVRDRAAKEGAGYTPTITLGSRAAGEVVHLTVADNGPGMPDDVAARLFEPFFTTKPSGSGTGLGLSLAHDIVQGHGGTIAVQTEVG
ncbi:MAG: hypothetical protein HKN04_12700, partial [Rhodothermaceae bacterium]|nr:hypothetical protein [Rhodothermaceae bacterium]